MRTVRNSSRLGGRGVYLVPGGVPAQVLPPVDRHTRVKT